MHLSKRTSYLLSAALSAIILAGCGTSNRAPITSAGGSSAATGSGVHVVQRGDTLYSIARRHNVSVNQLLSLNNISNASQIEVGQRLRLGTGAPATAATRTPAASTSSASSSSPRVASDAKLVSWDWPVRGNIISQYSESTRGIDIAGSIGDPVKAAAAGTVSYVGNGLRGLGNLILITHGNGFISAYAHNDKLLVKQNERVTKGQKIAELGQSDTTSPRLHFEIRRNGSPVNPLSYLPR
ncbi:MAG: peptidoglycan DD-metalloendopeptidase family protein [Pelistega sp.]|nr:peptidoglycan DD-metalloendopeptidase family protein [Pelistega sp.]